MASVLPLGGGRSPRRRDCRLPLGDTCHG
jgi:hypothetical protein